jgi:hypothetical protein
MSQLRMGRRNLDRVDAPGRYLYATVSADYLRQRPWTGSHDRIGHYKAGFPGDQRKLLKRLAFSRLNDVPRGAGGPRRGAPLDGEIGNLDHTVRLILPAYVKLDMKRRA